MSRLSLLGVIFNDGAFDRIEKFFSVLSSFNGLNNSEDQMVLNGHSSGRFSIRVCYKVLSNAGNQINVVP